MVVSFLWFATSRIPGSLYFTQFPLYHHEDAVEALKQIFNSPSLPGDYEKRLRETGELIHLEKAGIVPVLEELDPSDQSRAKLEELNQRLEKRNEVLRYIAIGMIEGGILFRRR